MTDLYDLGQRPPLGDVPTRMHAYVVRQNRFGPPRDAWEREVIPTPSIGADEVLIYVMASGINYNNVWAALGYPVDVIGERQKLGETEDFHAGGSDCAGIVWTVGKDVKNVRVGDEVIVHSGWWRADDPWVKLSGLTCPRDMRCRRSSPTAAAAPSALSTSPASSTFRCCVDLAHTPAKQSACNSSRTDSALPCPGFWPCRFRTLRSIPRRFCT